jgi:photosystem II stability/assembly factor-like uncharacterized protein
MSPARGRGRLIALTAMATLLLGACSNGGTGGSSSAGKTATQFVHVHGLAVDRSGVLWVATHRGLIRQSGSDWVYASTDRNDYMGFSADPTSGTMYRSGHPESGGTLGVESSSDGRTWRHLADVLNPPADFHAMALSYASPQIMYGWDSGGRGFFVSSDAGTKWDQLPGKGPADPRIVALGAAKQSGVVLAGTPTGLYRSADTGSTWTAVTGMIQSVSAIGCDPADSKHLLVATEGGLRLSRDGGSSWQPASQGIPAGEYIGAVAISPIDPAVAYAAGATTIYKTTDGGQSWTVTRSGS